MLKPKIDKLEVRSKVSQFAGYPKRTREHYFYSQIDQKVFVSTNDRFLENNYMMSNRARCDIDWKALKYTPTSAQETMGLKVYTPIIPVSFSTPVPHRSGRVVIQPDRFMYLRESSTQFHRNMRLIPQITMK